MKGMMKPDKMLGKSGNRFSGSKAAPKCDKFKGSGPKPERFSGSKPMKKG